MEIVTLGIAEYKVTKNHCILESVSLGSCVGIALFDLSNKIGALAHTMLPDSSSVLQRNQQIKPGKFVDTAIKTMLDEMLMLGASKAAIVGKIAGGACMFETCMADPLINIGSRNIHAARLVLAQEKINIATEDVGSTYGRTLRFDTKSGLLYVDSCKWGQKII